MYQVDGAKVLDLVLDVEENLILLCVRARARVCGGGGGGGGSDGGGGGGGGGERERPMHRCKGSEVGTTGANCEGETTQDT